MYDAKRSEIEISDEIILGKDSKKEFPEIKWVKPWDMLIEFSSKGGGGDSPIEEIGYENVMWNHS